MATLQQTRHWVPPATLRSLLLQLFASHRQQKKKATVFLSEFIFLWVTETDKSTWITNKSSDSVCKVWRVSFLKTNLINHKFVLLLCAPGSIKNIKCKLKCIHVCIINVLGSFVTSDGAAKFQIRRRSDFIDRQENTHTLWLWPSSLLKVLFVRKLDFRVSQSRILTLCDCKTDQTPSQNFLSYRLDL